MAEKTFKPNEAMKTACRRALEWKEQGKPGGTQVGMKRARDIVAGRSLSLSTVKRVRSFFARHKVDRLAEGFNPGEKGYPSKGRVAWDLWGGDAGEKWSNRIVSDESKNSKEKSRDVSTKGALPRSHVRAEIPMSGVEVREAGEGQDFAEFEGYGLRWSDEAEIGFFFRFIERFERGAFKKTISERGPNGNGQIKLLRQHNDRQAVAAKILDMREDSTGLWFRAQTIDTSVGRDLAVELREGVIDTLSIRFDVIREEIDHDSDPIERTVAEARLYEISAVLWPAYESATVEAVRGIEDGTAEQFIALLEREARSGSLTDESKAELERIREYVDEALTNTENTDDESSDKDSEADAGGGSGNSESGPEDEASDTPPVEDEPREEPTPDDRHDDFDYELEIRERELSI